MQSLIRFMAVFLILAGLGIGGLYYGEYIQKKEIADAAAKDTKLVASILIFECNDIKGLILIPQHSPPVFKDGSDGIPLQFYRDSVILSKNGVMKLDVPCPKRDTLTYNK
jgi:hypothetical protein